MAVAPIVIFCYNRPWHLEQTLNALKKNAEAKESILYVFCDGPKPYVKDRDYKNIQRVAEICSGISGFKSVNIVASETNQGLQQSVIKGLNQVFTKHDSAIVVEDDVITSAYFLQFMNEGLEFYKSERKVLSLGSWNYFHRETGNFFTRMPDTIAWATWKDRWQWFEPDGQKLYRQLAEKKRMDAFNLDQRFNFEDMLRKQISGITSSWAIRWTAVAVLRDTLTLYPKQALSKHIGFGSDSTNCEGEDYNKNLVLATSPIPITAVPYLENKAAIEAWLQIEQLVKRSPLLMGKLAIRNKPGLIQRLRNKVLGKLKAVLRRKTVYGWSGNYQNWSQVLQLSEGYNQQHILEKVKFSLTQVKDGKAAYERDGIAFPELEYSLNLLKTLKHIGSGQQMRLHLLDFGGSLGSLYFQYRDQLKELQIRWHVVEQSHFAECGEKEFSNKELHFFKTIEESEKIGHSDVLLLSSVLAYLPEPYAFLNSITKYRFKYLVFYRTAFIEGDIDRLTLQVVPPEIYKASYPAWFFNETKILDVLKKNYDLIDEFPGDIETEMDLEGQRAYWKGLVFKRK